MGVRRAAGCVCAYMSVVVCAIVCAALLMLTAAVPALADMGPKPTVIVTVKGLPEGECYGTLLSQTDSTGPESAYESSGYKQLSEGGEEVWQAFDDYAKTDPDGFYFLQLTWDVASTGTLDWTYYPPETFKVALYFPETGAVVTSGVLQRYAFDSTYEIDLTDVDVEALQADALSARETGTQRNDGTDEAKEEADVLPVRETGTVATALPGAHGSHRTRRSLGLGLSQEESALLCPACQRRHAAGAQRGARGGRLPQGTHGGGLCARENGGSGVCRGGGALCLVARWQGPAYAPTQPSRPLRRGRQRRIADCGSSDLAGLLI